MTPAQQYEYFKNDYLAHDGIETVTLTPAPGITGAAHAGAVALFGELSRRELASLGAELIAAPFDTIITLYDVTLNGLKPEARFLVTQAGGEKWNLVNAVQASFGTQWICTATRGK